jgi:hypothetical protein
MLTLLFALVSTPALADPPTPSVSVIFPDNEKKEYAGKRKDVLPLPLKAPFTCELAFNNEGETGEGKKTHLYFLDCDIKGNSVATAVICGSGIRDSASLHITASNGKRYKLLTVCTE